MLLLFCTLAIALVFICISLPIIVCLLTEKSLTLCIRARAHTQHQHSFFSARTHITNNTVDAEERKRSDKEAAAIAAHLYKIHTLQVSHVVNQYRWKEIIAQQFCQPLAPFDFSCILAAHQVTYKKKNLNIGRKPCSSVFMFPWTRSV